MFKCKLYKYSRAFASYPGPDQEGIELNGVSFVDISYL